MSLTQQGNFINELEAHEYSSPSLDGTCYAFQWPKPCFQDDDRSISVSPSHTSDVCGIIVTGLAHAAFPPLCAT
jgi:hypothetical protein